MSEFQEDGAGSWRFGIKLFDNQGNRAMQLVFAYIQWLIGYRLHSLHKRRCECETI